MAQGKPGYDQQLYEYAQLSNGTNLREVAKSFQDLVINSLPLSVEEARAIAYLSRHTTLQDNLKLNLFEDALALRHVQQQANLAERGYFFPKGIRCFVKAIYLLSSIVPNLNFQRVQFRHPGSSSNSPSSKLEQHRVEEISIAEFAREIEGRISSFHYLVGGDIKFHEWALYWARLDACDYVRPRRNNRIWEEFVRLFVVRKDDLLGYAEAANVRKRVSTLFVRTDSEFFPGLRSRKENRIYDPRGRSISRTALDSIALINSARTLLPRSSYTLEECLKKMLEDALSSWNRSELRPSFWPIKIGACDSCHGVDLDTCHRILGIVDRSSRLGVGDFCKEWLCKKCFDDFIDEQFLAIDRDSIKG